MSHALSRAASFESCCSDSVVAGMMFSFRVHSFHFMGGHSARPRSPSMDPSLDPNQNELGDTGMATVAYAAKRLKLRTQRDRTARDVQGSGLTHRRAVSGPARGPSDVLTYGAN